MKQRHIPRRTCVACRSSDEKRVLLRVVRQADGVVRFDETGKAAGRGAYICATLGCIQTARKQRRLERSLKVAALDEGLFDDLQARVANESGGDSKPHAAVHDIIRVGEPAIEAVARPEPDDRSGDSTRFHESEGS